MKSLSEIKEYLSFRGYGEDGSPDVLLFDNPDYATAFIGVSHNDRAVYDYYKMVDFLVNEKGMNYEDAMDFVNYNTMCSIPPDGPVVVYGIDGE